MCARTCVCAPTCVHVCMHVEARIRSCVIPQELETFSDTGSLTSLGHTNSTRQVEQYTPETCGSLPPQRRNYISKWVLGIKIKSSCLQGKCFNEIPLPSPPTLHFYYIAFSIALVYNLVPDGFYDSLPAVSTLLVDLLLLLFL